MKILSKSVKSAVCCLLATIGIVSSAMAATIEVGSASVQCGEAFAVTLAIDSGEEPLAGYQVDIYFDPSVIQITGVLALGPWAGGLTATNLSKPGVAKIASVQITAVETGRSEVALLTFVAKGPPGSSTALHIGDEFPVIANLDAEAILPLEKVDGIVQVYPACAGPCSGGVWKNHGEYVSAVAHSAETFLAAGLIDQEQLDSIVAEAAQSDCGRKTE